MEAKVYVVSNNGYEFDAAKQFGELVYLTSGFVDIHKDYAEIESRLANILDDATLEDYLLLVGVNLVCVLAYSLMKKKLNADINILHWNSNSKGYVTYKI